MVFGLENVGSVVLLLNDGHEGKCEASGVCREMAWTVQRVMGNVNCKQALQHSLVSAMVRRDVCIGMDSHPTQNCSFVRGQ
jgi:hypothetical protein